MKRGGWNRIPASKRLQRKEATREKAKRFLIVTEGKETEPNYFKHFGSAWIKVEVVGGNGQWRRVVEVAEKIHESSADEIDEVWCVFDRDIDGKNPNAKELFNQALTLAQARGFGVAYSIDAFELWFLLHFELYSNSTLRSNYASKLSARR